MREERGQEVKEERPGRTGGGGAGNRRYVQDGGWVA